MVDFTVYGGHNEFYGIFAMIVYSVAVIYQFASTFNVIFTVR